MYNDKNITFKHRNITLSYIVHKIVTGNNQKVTLSFIMLTKNYTVIKGTHIWQRP